MASPKAKPAGLKIIEGRGNGRDSGGRKIKESPGFKRDAPSPPSWLSKEARDEWDRIVPELVRLNVTKPLDRAALAAYCETWSRFVWAQDAVRIDGLTVIGSQGQPVKNPAVAIAEAASKEIRAWAAEFGLTPSAENNLAGAKGEDGDKSNPFGAPLHAV
jgi:P27 family predicted phage terminase small subunit